MSARRGARCQACGAARPAGRLAARAAVLALVLAALPGAGAVLAQQPPAGMAEAAPIAAGNGAGAEALYREGMALHEGIDRPPSFRRAAALMQQAAALGHPGAQNQLARYLFEGLGVAPDPEEALAWFARAAARGDPQHVFDQAAALDTAPGGLRDPAAAARLYAQAAEAGHVEAAVNLGVLLQEGDGVAQDHAAAFTLYSRAAEAGHPRGQNNLGLLYVRGHGVAQDYAKAAALFRSAAEQGLAPALSNLGVMVANGFGVAADEALAAELYRAGAAGRPGAGGLLYDPRLVPPPTGRPGVQATVRAANRGDPVAQFQLGYLIATGAVAGGSDADAARLFRAAAEKGHGPAMANLGILHFDGRGVLQDFVAGYMWLSLAAAAGMEEARGRAAAAAGRMTPAQIDAAQERAAQRWGDGAPPQAGSGQATEIE